MTKYIQIIKRSLQVTIVAILAIWVTGYFVVCFTEWYMLNPIQWVIDLPEASQRDRGAYLGCLSTLMLLSFIAAFIEDDISGGATSNITTSSPPSYIPEAQRSESSLDAVDIALGVAGGVVIGGIIGDILD